MCVTPPTLQAAGGGLLQQLDIPAWSSTCVHVLTPWLKYSVVICPLAPQHQLDWCWPRSGSRSRTLGGGMQHPARASAAARTAASRPRVPGWSATARSVLMANLLGHAWSVYP